MQNPVPGPKPSYPIESVDNVLQILLWLAESERLRVSEVAASLGVARSTAHRLLAMLQYRGFVEKDASGRVYVPGPSLSRAGLAALHRKESWSVARPVIERLSNVVLPSATVRTEAGRVRQVRTIDLEQAPAAD